MFDPNLFSPEMVNARAAVLRREFQLLRKVEAALAPRKAEKAEAASLRRFRLMYKVRHFLFRVAPRFASRLIQ